MRIAVIGAGAMGSLFGSRLAAVGNDVTLVDVWQEAVARMNAGGLRLTGSDGQEVTLPVRATTDPATVGPVDLALVFVKCYDTEAAVRSAAPLLGAGTAVLSLQNGWGNAPRIAALVGPERVLAGVTYHSATVLGPGRIHHAGVGPTFIGELNGAASDRLARVAAAFNAAGLETTATPAILTEIWAKLSLNVCTLPLSSLLRFHARQLGEHAGTLALMRELMREVVAVANAQGVPLDAEERWTTITSGLARRAPGSKPSMLQDVENHRRTEIDVICGAVVEAGQRLGLPTPYNQAMLWLVRSLEESYGSGSGPG